MPPVHRQQADAANNFNLDRNMLIRMYFSEGYTYREIQGFLFTQHGYPISLRYLYRLLSSLGHMRHSVQSDIADVVVAIAKELQTHSQNFGYRFMRMRLAEQLLIASNETVRLCLSILDPVGVAGRQVHRLRTRVYRNRGPNYAIHMDGWDKLKPYGISVHGAIDGFSKRLLWLRACHSNKNPEYIVNFFLNYVEEINGVPRLVCSNQGTENCLVRDIQRSLRENHNDDMSGMASFRYVPSTQNVKIERFWNFLKMSQGIFWINLFKDMVDHGVLNLLDQTHIQCVRFVFIPVIQRELNKLCSEWNKHRVQRNRYTDTPCGKPNVLFYQPELFGTLDYKYILNEDIEIVREVVGDRTPPELGCSDGFADVCLRVMIDNDYHLPNDYVECVALFGNLIEKLRHVAH